MASGTWTLVYRWRPATKGNSMASMFSAELDEARDRGAAAAGCNALDLDPADIDEQPFQSIVIGVLFVTGQMVRIAFAGQRLLG